MENNKSTTFSNVYDKTLETYLLQSPEKLCFMNNLLSKYQFSEDYLIETISYYDSWKCIRTQDNLSPYFCFKYLYDNDTDSADDWTDYNTIYKYLKNKGFSDIEIEESFNSIYKE